MAQLAVFGPAGCTSDGTLIDQFQRADGVGDEKLRAAAIIGQRHNGRDNLTVAHEITKPCFHPVYGDQYAAWDAVLARVVSVANRVAP